MLATLPARTHGLGLITELLLEDLQLERTTYGQINLWATLVGSLLCLPAGRLLDRMGVRWTSTLVLGLLGSIVVAMSRVQSTRELFLWVTLTRAIGQSALSVVSISMVGKWFSRHGGPAMGIYSVLMGVGFAAAFGTVGYWVKNDGWRTAWDHVGWSVLALAPIYWLLVRDNPESCGLTVERTPHSESTDLDGHTLAQALRTHAFWLFAVATSLFGLVVAGLGLFNQSILAEFGFDADTYRAMLVLSTAAGLGGQIIGGLAAHRWSVKRVLSAAMLTYAVSLVGLPWIKDQNQLRCYAIVLGASGGAITVVFFACWGKMFGRAHLGRIQGAAQMLTVVSSAVGPLLFAETQLQFRSYVPILWTLAATAAGCGLAAWFVTMPVRAHRSDANAGTLSG